MTTSADAYVRFNRDFFRRWVGVYDAFAATMAPAYRAAARAALELSPTSVLDVCTGTGQVATRLAVSTQVVAIDLSPDMLAKARRRASRLAPDAEVRLLEMDARHLAFDARAFDAVTISLALHDMPRRIRLEVLAEAARVARRRLVVLDYRLPSSRFLRAPALWAVDLFETPYFRGFVQEGAESLFADVGLEPSSASTPWPLFGIWVFDL